MRIARFGPSSLTLVLLFLAVSPARGFAQEDSLAGVFSADGLQMIVVATGSDTYVGRFQLGNEWVPFRAQGASALGVTGMQGQYTQGGVDTAFEAILTGAGVIVGDGNQTFILQRSSEAVSPELEQEILAAAEGGGQAPGAVGQPQQEVASATGQAPSGGANAQRPAVTPASVDQGVNDPYLGLAFRPPPGWTSSAQDGGFLLQSAGNSAQILVILHEMGSLEELRASARQGYTDGTTSLRLSGDITPFGANGVQARMEGAVQGQPIAAMAIGLLSPHGGGVSLLGVAEASAFDDQHVEAIRTAAESVRFSQPRPPDAISEWRDKLWNARLTYLYSYYSGGVDGTYVGASEETVIDTCGQGFFNYGSKGSLAADGGFGSGYNAAGYQASNQSGSGRWEVVGQGGEAVLRLNFHDGSVHEYTLTVGEDGKGTYLNGERYYRTYSNSPLEDARPTCP